MMIEQQHSNTDPAKAGRYLRIRVAAASCRLLILALLTMPALAEDYPDSARWLYIVGGFQLEDEIVGGRSGQIVATGSSSMRFWDHSIHRDFAPLPIISRGFGGSNMYDLLVHLDAIVLKHKPAAVIIYEGDNDIAQGVPVPVVIDTFEKVVRRIHADNPTTRIYLISVKPSVAREALWGQMRQVNEGMWGIANRERNVYYIDVATPMLRSDGRVRTDLFVADDLHMNQAGYDIWRNVVVPLVKQVEAGQ